MYKKAWTRSKKMEFINILTFISGLLIIFVLCRIFILPLKFIFKLFLNSFLGAVLILLINLVRKHVFLSYRSKLFYYHICKHFRHSRCSFINNYSCYFSPSMIILYNTLLKNVGGFCYVWYRWIHWK